MRNYSSIQVKEATSIADLGLICCYSLIVCTWRYYSTSAAVAAAVRCVSDEGGRGGGGAVAVAAADEYGVCYVRMRARWLFS